jgi:biopolymer transport protein ExbB
MMWPLLILSIESFAVVAERVVFFTTRRFPASDSLGELFTLARNGEKEAALERIENDAPTYLPLFKILFNDSPEKEKGQELQLTGENLLFSLSRRLDFLSTVVATAPLIGLLGTVFGMIEAFSRLSASNNVDITMLAGGIWQALLTTAAGLCVTIPTLLAHGWFCRQHEKTAFAMQRASNIFLEQKL